MSEDWKQGGKKVDTQAVTFGKVGDFIKGTYTGVKVVNTPNGETPLYELKGILGSFHLVDDRKNPVEPPVTVETGSYYNVWGSMKPTSGAYAMTSMLGGVVGVPGKARIGDIVAFQLVSETPSKTKGNAPFKKYESLQFGKDPNYMGEDSSALNEAFPGSETVEGVNV